MTTVLDLGVLLAAWTVLPPPVAVAVGRALATEGAALEAGSPAVT